LTNKSNVSLDSREVSFAVPKKTCSESDSTAKDIETKPVSILFVDDDDFMREIVVDILSELGYRVLAASDGAAALEILNNDRDLNLILTDLVMEDMNGLELAGKVQDLYPLVPIVFVSGSSKHFEVASEQRPNQVIQKPFTIKDLQFHIEAALRQTHVPKGC